MRLTKTVKFLTALLVGAIAVSANAQTTKKHHGIQGPKLIPQTATTKTYTYQVKGKTYTTKSSKNAKNYSKEGIASYYHKKFTDVEPPVANPTIQHAILLHIKPFR